MTERPILFSDAMVRAILAGAKTQTRRVMTPQPIEECGAPIVGAYHPIVVRRGIEEPGPERWGASTEEQSWPCPYGRPGDRLYVREAWGHAFTYGGGSQREGCSWAANPWVWCVGFKRVEGT